MKKTKIILAGDLLPMPCNYDLFSAGDTQALFGEKLCALFASADYRVCNFEGCFTDSDRPIEKIGPSIKAPVSSINAIKNLGIDYATLGNTHSMDYGRQGYLDTCRTLEENGVGYFGWGENAASVKSYVEIEDGGRKIILYNTTERFENAPRENYPGVNLYDEYRVCQEIKELKERCDFLIVLYHGGIEGTHYNSKTMRRRFHRMADNGADVVISQHTHAIGEEEHYHHSYLLYGQGNFCFHFRPDVTPLLAEGLVLELDWSWRSAIPALSPDRTVSCARKRAASMTNSRIWLLSMSAAKRMKRCLTATKRRSARLKKASAGIATTGRPSFSRCCAALIRLTRKSARRSARRK